MHTHDSQIKNIIAQHAIIFFIVLFIFFYYFSFTFHCFFYHVQLQIERTNTIVIIY
jgi:hypothetical protein